MSPMSHDSDDV